MILGHGLALAPCWDLSDCWRVYPEHQSAIFGSTSDLPGLTGEKCLEAKIIETTLGCVGYINLEEASHCLEMLRTGYSFVKKHDLFFVGNLMMFAEKGQPGSVHVWHPWFLPSLPTPAGREWVMWGPGAGLSRHPPCGCGLMEASYHVIHEWGGCNCLWIKGWGYRRWS